LDAIHCPLEQNPVIEVNHMPGHLLGCATCANSFREGGGDAIGWSIMALLVIIAAVLFGVGFFMIRIARRESALLDPALCDDPVQRNP
jgi:hypothetical protein